MVDIKNMPFAEHSRGPFYQVHLATGVCASLMGDRAELSFFADRVKHIREQLEVAIPGTELLRPNGQIEVIPQREHVTGVSLNYSQLIQMKDLVEGIIRDMEAQSEQIRAAQQQADA